MYRAGNKGERERARNMGEREKDSPRNNRERGQEIRDKNGQK